MASQDLTKGNITAKLWTFAAPLILCNVMQQLYNLADTWIVGRYIGEDALASVGSSYTLMTFLTSIIFGMCLGSSAFFSISYGEKDFKKIRNGIFVSFVIIFAVTLLLSFFVFWQIDGIIEILQVPLELFAMTKTYLYYVFFGIFATFIFNYFSNLLRGLGNSVAPLVFLAISVLLNIGLDFYFVLSLKMGVKGAAVATVISQYVSAVGIFIYIYFKYAELHLKKEDMKFKKKTVKDIVSLSGYTCIQQSVMNLGILMVQGIVNGFGATVMSAFAVAVKIDTVAYMPVQDFGNAFSTFIAQNYGAKKHDRIEKVIRQSLVSVVVFCVAISVSVFVFAPYLMQIFVSSTETEIIAVGVQYLRIEGAFYIGIGILFMLYGYYRAINQPKMSIVLTVISLGSRVLISYFLSKIDSIGVVGIWTSIPIGWFLADAFGIVYFLRNRRKEY